jgi:Subtilase family
MYCCDENDQPQPYQKRYGKDMQLQIRCLVNVLIWQLVAMSVAVMSLAPTLSYGKSTLFKGNNLGAQLFNDGGYSGALPRPALVTANGDKSPKIGLFGLNVYDAWYDLFSDNSRALPYLLGKDIQVANLELVHYSHSNLPNPKGVIPKKYQPNGICGGYISHGTATMGIMVARPYDITDRTREGTLGIVPNARYYVTNSPVIDDNGTPACSGRSWRNADYAKLDLLVDNLNAGDVVNASLGFVNGSDPLLYREDLEAFLVFVKKLAGKGVVTVMAAGNTGKDLSADVCQYWTNGALSADKAPILVGMSRGDSFTDGNYRDTASNYGDCVTMFSWGSGYSALHVPYANNPGVGSWPRTLDTFGGTSGAASLVAGTIAAMQGYAKYILGRPLTLEEVKQIVEETGTQSADPLRDRIGKQPNLRAAIKSIDELRANECRKSGGARTQGTCSGSVSTPDDNDVYGNPNYASPNLPDPTALQPNPQPGAACAGARLGWPERSLGPCFGLTSNTISGSISTALADPPNSGSATFKCENTAWSVENNVCVAATKCAAQTISWPGSSATCSAQLREGLQGEVVDVNDLVDDEIGEASYRCDSTGWTKLAGRCSYTPSGKVTYTTVYSQLSKPDGWGVAPHGYKPITLNAAGVTNISLSAPPGNKRKVRLLIQGDTNGAIAYGDCASRWLTVWPYGRDSGLSFAPNAQIEDVVNDPTTVNSGCRVRHVLGSINDPTTVKGRWIEYTNGRPTSNGSSSSEIKLIGPYTWEQDDSLTCNEKNGASFCSQGRFEKPIAMPAVLDFDVFDTGARRQNVSVQWRGYRIEIEITRDPLDPNPTSYPAIHEWKRHNVDAGISQWDEYSYRPHGMDAPSNWAPWGRTYTGPWEIARTFLTMSSIPSYLVDYGRQLLRCDETLTFKQTSDNCISLGYVLNKANFNAEGLPWLEQSFGKKKDKFVFVKMEPDGHGLKRPFTGWKEQENVANPFSSNNPTIDQSPHWYLVFRPTDWGDALSSIAEMITRDLERRRMIERIVTTILDDDDD